MKIFQDSFAFLCIFIPLATAQGFPGPLTVRPATLPLQGGTPYTEEWFASPSDGAASVIFPVRDFDVIGVGEYPNMRLRPTLVYNCALMRAICANVRDAATRQNWPGFATSQTKVMHFDKDLRVNRKGVRANERRKHSCPTNWITTPRSPGVPRCPLPNGAQPQFQTDDITRLGQWQDGVMHKEIDATGLGYDPDSINDLGRQTSNINIHGLMEWDYTGTILTCDEIPAASWIEGGGTGLNAASTTCAPMSDSCRGQGWGGPRSEQNWQADGHRAIGSWSRANTPQGQQGANNRQWSIYKFNLMLVDDRTLNAPAVWVQAGVLNTKRACYGPLGATFYDCEYLLM